MLDLSSILNGVVSDLPISAIFSAAALGVDFVGHYICKWLGCSGTELGKSFEDATTNYITTYLHYFVVILGALCFRRIFPQLFRFNL